MEKINMTFGFYVDYLRKCRVLLSRVHVKEHLSMVWLWTDSVWSFVRYGCTVSHYVQGEFYRMRGFERRNVVTFRKFKKLMELNDPAYIPILRDKDKFNVHFASFVHRDWLKASTMTYDDFLAFCNRHRRFVIKPLDGMEGNGVNIMITPPIP